MNVRVNYRSVGLFAFLLLVSLLTGYQLIESMWSQPWALLFADSASLSLEDMAVQMQIVPTMVMAVLAGGSLGLVSVLLQQLVKNTLASDTTLAVGSGAQMALMIVTLFLPSFGLYGSFWVAFVGVLFSMGLVFAMAAPSRMNPVVLVLSGLIVNIVLVAISSLLLIFFSEAALGVMAFAGGVLAQTSWTNLQELSAAVVLVAVLLIPLLKPLTLMSLDDRQAQSMGVPVQWIRGVVLLLVALLTALVVSQVGILSFVGLAAATLVNVLSVRRVGMRLILAFLFGGLLLLLTNNVVMLLASQVTFTIPTGAMTGVLGAPLIIWLILRQRKNRSDEVAPSMTLRRAPVSWWLWSVVLVIACAGVLVVAKGPTGWQKAIDAGIIAEFRLPRTLSAAATGMMLATAGVLLQTMTRNPMASPEVLGISSGSAMGVLLAFMLSPILGYSLSVGGMLLAGVIGGFIVMILVLWMAQKLQPAYLLLVGIAIAALMNSLLTLIKLSGDPRLQAILSWLSGTTYSARPETAWWLFAVAAGLFVAAFLLIKPLRVLSLGETIARGLGISIKLNELLILAVVAGLSAAATLAVGPLSFAGLMIPHLAKSMGAVQLERQLPLAAVLGAILMVLADWFGRYVIFPYEIPAGTIAAIVGGGYFVYLMRKMKPAY